MECFSVWDKGWRVEGVRRGEVGVERVEEVAGVERVEEVVGEWKEEGCPH